MITIEIKITTESGDQVVNISQKCHSKNLSKVLQSAENLYNAIDDKPTDESRFVRK